MSVQTEAAGQTRIALRKAEATRLARAKTRREIASAPTMRDSLLRAIEVLQDPPPHMARMTVHAFLASIRRMGAHSATKLCGRGHISELRYLGDLTVRELTWLAAALRAKADPTAGPAPDLWSVFV